MRRLIIVTLTWLFCFSPAAGAADITQPCATAGNFADNTAARAPQGALYRVHDGHHSLLLFGTIHVGLPAFYPLEPRLMHALEQAPALALELDPGNGKAAREAVQKYGILPAGQRYRDLLSPGLAERTLQAVVSAGIPAPSTDNFRPWLLAVTLTVQAYEHAGYQTALAVDNHLANYMHEHGKPVVELEGIDAQLNLMASMSQSDQVRFLSDALDDIDDADSRRKIDELVGAWCRADHQALEQALAEMRRQDSFTDRFTLQQLLDGRNPGLADGIARLLKDQDQAVAAVGILHLVGPHGIPALLRQRGLQVEQLY